MTTLRPTHRLDLSVRGTKRRYAIRQLREAGLLPGLTRTVEENQGNRVNSTESSRVVNAIDGAHAASVDCVQLGLQAEAPERANAHGASRTEPFAEAGRGRSVRRPSGIVKQAARSEVTVTCSDVANAQRLISGYGADLKYCVEWKKWLVWDGRRWKLDHAATEPTRRAIFTALTLADSDESKRDSTLYKWAARSQNHDRIQAMMHLACTSETIATSHETFDAHHDVFNALNGTVDLRTGTLRDYDRKDLSTKLGGTQYLPDHPTPNWTKFLGDVTRGDAHLESYLQRVFGYMLTGDVREQVIFFFFGGGSNGKGTFLDVLGKVLGEYAQPAPRGLLEADHSDDHLTRIASLYRVRLAVCAEVERGRDLAESLVKDLTGGDKLAARRMREDLWFFHPTHKLVMQGNHKPIIQGNDHGIWRRIHSVPWLAKFEGDDRVFDFGDRLREEMPGILAWAVEGCMQWRRYGLAPPRSVLDLTAKYRREMDNVEQYASERIVVSLGGAVSKEDVREDYEAWCGRHEGYVAANVQTFTTRLRAYVYPLGGFEGKAKFAGGPPYSIRAWKNVTLRPEETKPVALPAPATH